MGPPEGSKGPDGGLSVSIEIEDRSGFISLKRLEILGF
jgi:hypothetical protein